MIIDRLNACKYWKSEIDCEMVELLIIKYKEIDWAYLEKKAAIPENNVLAELMKLKKRHSMKIRVKNIKIYHL